MRVLNVAEKNDAAKNIANILSRGSAQRSDGQSMYNKVFRFECDVPQIASKCQMTMTSVSGHLLNYEFPLSHAKWDSCDPVDLFDAPVMKKTSSEDVRKNLLNFACICDHLIIWTDCDREGENIGYEIIGIVQSVKPNIRVWRAKFSEITGRSIFHAISHLIEPDLRAAKAVDVRQELDLRIGAAFTRFQTLYLQRQNLRPAADTNGKSIVSYGSCQFPTLGFVVQRYKERIEFQSQPFWFLSMNHQKDDVSVEFKWERNRLEDINRCLDYFIQVRTEPVVAKVVAVDSRPKSKWRPLPLNTVAFEKLAASKLKMSAKEAMKIAEKLYTAGVISYPRTETNMFPKTLNLQNHVHQQTESTIWGNFAAQLIQEGIHPRQGKQTDNAHPPIYPTKFATGLTGQEARVYELITRHFLACCSSDAQGKETNVTAEVNGEKFKAGGLIILKRGYLEVYPYEKWSAKELPNYELNETFVPDQVAMNEGATTAPQLLTESDLISLMERHGIGTDATHAEHIETIKARQYVVMTSDRRLKPLRLGLGLIEAYNKIKEEMSKPHLRARLERDLQAICDGTKEPAEVLQEQIEMYRSVFLLVSAKASILGQEIRRSNETYRDDNDDGSNNSGGPRNGPPGGPGSRRGGGDDNNDGRGGRGGRSVQRQPLRDVEYAVFNPTENTENVSSESVPKCKCGQPANVKKVSKEGPNCGRSFYGCPNFKGTGTGCDFFEWADQPAKTNSYRPAAAGSTRGRRGGSVSTGTRKCGNCGQTGHIRSRCPNPPQAAARGSKRGIGRRGRGRERLPTSINLSAEQAMAEFEDYTD